MKPTSVRNFPRTDCGVFSIAIVNIISRSALVGFSLLRAIYYYDLMGLVSYLYLMRTFKFTVSYQFMSALRYRNIHLIRFICSYCTLSTTNMSFYYALLLIITKNLLISQISNQFLCNILCHTFLLQTSTYTNSQNHLSSTQSKH